jgi:hypothetical protein
MSHVRLGGDPARATTKRIGEIWRSLRNCHRREGKDAFRRGSCCLPRPVFHCSSHYWTEGTAPVVPVFIGKVAE